LSGREGNSARDDRGGNAGQVLALDLFGGMLGRRM
jgi:hypothetical protein